VRQKQSDCLPPCLYKNNDSNVNGKKVAMYDAISSGYNTVPSRGQPGILRMRGNSFLGGAIAVKSTVIMNLMVIIRGSQAFAPRILSCIMNLSLHPNVQPSRGIQGKAVHKNVDLGSQTA